MDELHDYAADLGASDLHRRALSRGAMDDLEPRDAWCARCGPDAQPALLYLDGSDMDCDLFCVRCHEMVHWAEQARESGAASGQP